MKCPGCDVEMYPSDEDENVWVCPKCYYVEDRS
jgi:DNA-directed RNA polymerase subunit M/transcription elongation factor TFIIS